MDKVRQFRERAVECRKLAQQFPQLRVHYEQAAWTWDKLADEREQFFVEMQDAPQA